MPKKSSPKKRKARKPSKESFTQATGRVIKEKWETTVKSIASAQSQMEKQIQRLVRRNKLGGDAAKLLKDIRERAEREGRKAAKSVESRLSALQERVDKERKNLGRLIDDGVHATLVALNIPSRQEVAELTRKVDQLSRKIDNFKGEPAARRTPERKPVSSPSGL
jgi:poly(hydroxyalkanoate) granule-associated protein